MFVLEHAHMVVLGVKVHHTIIYNIIIAHTFIEQCDLLLPEV